MVESYKHDYPVTMEFRLTYEGVLHSSGNSPNATEKHEIRRIFHIQLKKLWAEDERLKTLQYPPEFPAITSHEPPIQVITNGGPDRRESLADHLAKEYSRFKYHFVPLVTQSLALWCGLDILYLRAGNPGKVLQSGDIDGRVKTLFDALKMPRQMHELGKYRNAGVPNDEDPFYCLLEDGSLISRASVETDRLLEFVGGGPPSKDDARVIITVKLRPHEFKWENLAFL